VPGGSGFPEFHKTSDSHVSNSRRNMILAVRAQRDAAPVCGGKRAGTSGGNAESGKARSAGNAEFRFRRLDGRADLHPARFHGRFVAGQFGMLGLQSAMHGVLAKLRFD